MSYFSKVSYSGDGSNRIFAVPFDYLNQADIKLFDGASQIGFAFLSPTSIQATTAPAAGVNNVTLTRTTAENAMLATIQDGTIRPVDLNTDYKQLLFLIQELIDGNAGSQAIRVPFPETVTALGTAAARANNFLAFDAAGDPALLSVITPAGIVAGTKFVYASQYATLALADAAAAGLTGGVLVIDKEFTLAASLTMASKKIIFACKVTLGTFDLTFAGNQLLTVGGAQILDSTSTGKVKGDLAGDICIDWWGTTSTVTTDAATANAGNDCFIFVTNAMEAAGVEPVVYCTKREYFLSASWVKPSSNYCPHIDFRGALLHFNGITAANAGLVIIGVSGSLTTAHIANVLLEGDATSWGIEVRGQCGLRLENVRFLTSAWGLVLHNSTSGQFTEFVTWTNCSFACQGAWYFKRTSGNDSFNGSGPDGNVIVNFPASPAASIIIADANCSIYNAPMSCSIFPTVNTYTMVTLGAGTVWLTHGDLTIENAGTANQTINLLSGGARAFHSGSAEIFGGVFNGGDLIFIDEPYILNDGVVRGRRRGKVFTTPMASGGVATTIESSGSSAYLFHVFINITNYFWSGLVFASADPFGNNHAASLQGATAGGSNLSGWGSPTFAWDGTALTVSNASFPAQGSVTISTTDLGKYF